MSKHFTDREKSKLEKAKKEADKAEARKEKERVFQAKLVEQFNEKQAKAKATQSAQQKLKEWLANPPYKCSDRNLQVSSERISFDKNSWKLVTLYSQRFSP